MEVGPLKLRGDGWDQMETMVVVGKFLKRRASGTLPYFCLIGSVVLSRLWACWVSLRLLYIVHRVWDVGFGLVICFLVGRFRLVYNNKISLDPKKKKNSLGNDEHAPLYLIQITQFKLWTFS